jgi:hypothetical protein
LSIAGYLLQAFQIAGDQPSFRLTEFKNTTRELAFGNTEEKAKKV